MNREAASIEAAPSRTPANPRGRTGSLTRRMIGIAAIWIGALLLIGGFALDRVLARVLEFGRNPHGDPEFWTPAPLLERLVRSRGKFG